MAKENSLALTAMNPWISTHLSCVLWDSRKISVTTYFSKTLTDEAGGSLQRPSHIWRHSSGPKAKFCFLKDSRSGIWRGKQLPLYGGKIDCLLKPLWDGYVGQPLPSKLRQEVASSHFWDIPTGMKISPSPGKWAFAFRQLVWQTHFGCDPWTPNLHFCH